MALILNGSDTSAGNDAGLGYTSAEGIIITGQGSTSDVTIKNDADATVLSIPTGTTNVGIGTTSPSEKLEVSGNVKLASDNPQVELSDTGAGGTIWRIANGPDGNGKLTFNDSNTERVTFLNDGKVGIGTNTPGSELGFPIGNDVEISQVATTAHQAGNAGHIALTIGDGGNHAGFFVNNTHDGTYSDQHLTFKTAEGGVSVATERMRITPDGKVGIGTTSPTGKLTVSNEIDVLGSNFANVEFTGASVNGSGVYTGLDSGGGYVINVRDSGYIGFSTTNAERMRIASDGKVGIGTSSPAGRLHVHTSSAGTVTAATDANQLVLESTANVGMSFLTGNASVARIKFGDPDSNSSGAIVYAHSEDSMRFNTGGSERMRIRSNGQVLINSTSIIASDNAYLQVTGGSVTPVALRGGTNNYFMAFYKQSNNTLIGSITGSTGTTTSFNTSSDYRLKENVSYTFDATTRLKQLKPARFNFISDPDNTVDGFIAHEAQEVVPHAVTGEKDGKEMQVIDHSKLVPLLTASLQEALKRIDSLEEQVNALKGK